MSSPGVLYTALACNFCQRSKIVLAAKRVEFETVVIDLVRRPAWFRDKASGGSVPLFEHEGLALHGSTLINEYANERWPEPDLLPGDPGARATARMWIERWNAEPTPAYEERLMNIRPEREQACAERLAAAFEVCEQKLAARDYDGGYWHGSQLGLVDAAAAPVFVRFAGLAHFHGFDLPERLGRVRAWRDALLAAPVVKETSPDEAELLGVFRDYREVLSKAARAGIEVAVSGGN